MSHFSLPKRLLIVAQSARMLAQMAVDSGVEAVIIDVYADQDTRQLALDFRQLSCLTGDGFEQAVLELSAQYQITEAVYGSGLENYPHSLVFLESRLRVVGSSHAVFSQFLDKPAFFAQLTRLQIAVPETRFDPPKSGEWLVKPRCGQGGVGIRHWHDDQDGIDETSYWQRLMAGENYSALAVAANGQFQLLGFNQQWTRAHDFSFAGIANHAPLPDSMKQTVFSWLSILVEHYALQGLFSVDFICEHETPYLLEINPRIPASAQLYPGALAMHFDAGLSAQPAPRQFYAVLYADQDTRILEHLNWPEYVVDRPCAGQLIRQTEPICSIIGGFSRDQSPQQLAEQRLNSLQRLLQTGC